VSIGRSGMLGDASRFASINKRLDLPRAPYVCAIAYFDTSEATFVTPDAIDVRSNATYEGTDARDETPRASFTPARTE
jgi:hypothetical protein